MPDRTQLWVEVPGCMTGRPTRICNSMSWHVQYRRDAADCIARHASPELAIEAACQLIDDGCDVYGIGTGPLSDSIARADIARIHEFWARAKPRSSCIGS